MFACRYSPNELRYLPLNTALFEPPLDPELPALDSEPDSDDAEDNKDVKKVKNTSVSYMASCPLDSLSWKDFWLQFYFFCHDLSKAFIQGDILIKCVFC